MSTQSHFVEMMYAKGQHFLPAIHTTQHIKSIENRIKRKLGSEISFEIKSGNIDRKFA